jgi:uncharacterized protein (UPF0335 family)
MSCESNYVSHSNVGRHVFSILQTLDTLPTTGFQAHFLDLDDVKNMIKSTKEGTKLLPRILEMEQETFDKETSEIYQNIKQNGQDENISWNAIEYVDYKYDTSRNRSMTLNRGTLYFKNDAKKFSVEVYWLTNLQVSGLLGMARLQSVE